MSAEWKTETCETCEFQVAGLCRHGPMTESGYYPLVCGPNAKPAEEWVDNACAQWQRAAKEASDGDETNV